jgi:hypothetical protein
VPTTEQGVRCVLTTATRALAAERYAAKYKSPTDGLDEFIKRKGGINKCAFEVRSSPRAKWQDKGGLATKALPGNAFYAATEAEVVF